MYLTVFKKCEKLSTKVQVVIHKSTGEFKKVQEKLYQRIAGYFSNKEEKN